MPQTQTRPSTPQVFVIPPGGGEITGQEVQALRVRISELRDQLQDAASRRQNISGQLRRADPSARPGIEQRMQILDSRIAQLEKDITETGRQLTTAPPGALIAGTSMPPMDVINRVSDGIVPIVAILSVFVLAPFAITLSRFIWKRSSAPPRAAVTDQAVMQRLEQLQQSVDTIAIEVERISEGQRFVTKLLSERDRAVLGAGAAEPMRTSKKTSVPSERG